MSGISQYSEEKRAIEGRLHYKLNVKACILLFASNFKFKAILNCAFLNRLRKSTIDMLVFISSDSHS